MYFKAIVVGLALSVPTVAVAGDSGSIERKYEYLITSSGEIYHPIVGPGRTLHVKGKDVGTYMVSGSVKGKQMEIKIHISNRSHCEMIFNGAFFSQDDLFASMNGDNGDPFKFVSWGDGEKVGPKSSKTITGEVRFGNTKSRSIGFEPNGRVECD